MGLDDDAERERQARLRRFDQLGEAAVRLRVLAGGMPASHLNDAITWLGAKDQDRSARAEASNSEQMRLAREANTIARQAKIAAVIAAVLAAIGSIISVLSWLFPHV